MAIKGDVVIGHRTGGAVGIDQRTGCALGVVDRVRDYVISFIMYELFC